MRINSWLYLVSLVLFSSCFEYVEEITFKQDESGTFELTLNCSQSRLKLKNLLKLDTFMGINLPNENMLREHFSRATSMLNNAKGISQVEQSADFDQFIFKIKFQFDSISHLNEALNAIAAIESERHPLPYMTVYEYKNGVFKRLQVPNDSMLENAGKKHVKLFEGASFTSIYRFDKTVNKVSNNSAIISKNKNAVMLRKSATEIAQKPSQFSNTIYLK